MALGVCTCSGHPECKELCNLRWKPGLSVMGHSCEGRVEGSPAGGRRVQARPE